MTGFDTFLAQFLGRADPIASYVLEWAKRIGGPAVLRWGPVLATGMRCGLHTNGRPCPHPAVAPCEICRRPVCLLEHAMVAPNADVVCVHCVNEFAEIVRKRDGGARPGTPPQQVNDDAATRKRHLAALGLKDPATWEEIHDAFRALAKKHHPDRATPSKRAAAEAKFKTISAAYNWLDARRAKEAA